MTVPLHIATIGGHQLRFFRTPKDDGRPDLPWHCVDDLHRCLGLNREARRVFLRKLRAKWEIQTVATPDGILTIAPHYMAQGAIDAMVETGKAPASIRMEYALAGSDALKKLVPHLGFSDAFFAWMKAAMHRHEGATT